MNTEQNKTNIATNDTTLALNPIRISFSCSLCRVGCSIFGYPSYRRYLLLIQQYRASSALTGWGLIDDNWS
jgi:hypothetical protein